VLFLKTFKGVKFAVDGSAFQTFITLSAKNFCLMLAVHQYVKIHVMPLPVYSQQHAISQLIVRKHTLAGAASALAWTHSLYCLCAMPPKNARCMG